MVLSLFSAPAPAAKRKAKVQTQRRRRARPVDGHRRGDGPGHPGYDLRLQRFVAPLGRVRLHLLTTQWAYSLALVMFAVTMIPAGRLQDQIGPRKVAMIDTAVGPVLPARGCAGQRQPAWAFYLTAYSAAGIGFGYVCPISPQSCSPTRKG